METFPRVLGGRLSFGGFWDPIQHFCEEISLPLLRSRFGHFLTKKSWIISQAKKKLQLLDLIPGRSTWVLVGGRKRQQQPPSLVSPLLRGAVLDSYP